MGDEEAVDWYTAHNTASYDAEAAVEDVIDIILTRGGLALYETHMNKERITYSAAFAMSHLINAMQFGALNHDYGEPSPNPWTAEEEPGTLEIDTWAPGAVKVIKREPKPETSEPEPPQEPRPKLKSRRGRGSRSEKSETASPTNNTLAQTTDVNMTGVVPLIRNREKEITHEKQIKAIEAAARKKRAAADSSAKREAQELAEYEALMKEMKGKEFTIGPNGSVIVMGALNQDNLPSQDTAMRSVFNWYLFILGG
jgi:hypothetical protein